MKEHTHDDVRVKRQAVFFSSFYCVCLCEGSGGRVYRKVAAISSREVYNRMAWNEARGRNRVCGADKAQATSISLAIDLAQGGGGLCTLSVYILDK